MISKTTPTLKINVAPGHSIILNKAPKATIKLQAIIMSNNFLNLSSIYLVLNLYNYSFSLRVRSILLSGINQSKATKI